jgi:fructose-1,6-bisphosphatase/inositol monophosphatase family enzyme
MNFEFEYNKNMFLYDIVTGELISKEFGMVITYWVQKEIKHSNEFKNALRKHKIKQYKIQ